MVRIEPEEARPRCASRTCTGSGARGASAMTGWVLVEPEGVEDDAALERWVDVGAARAASMPPK